ncbi:transcription initiation factor tfiiib, brf1 subunit/transcription initiation factor tfiib [Candidatus Halobonum tyrrellensis]|uniref:Transcription initiation factor tfiiib, brf1 subunit/transcription initiation factor tfiib n=1 Tax=Candidatus Halobonum tyrrellensis G22 TaxID=1324957 RepID=V4HFL9_9EURY|nr:transcription initiation factor tfiiib, brf1 subunit/transcription initiation factor tfiib [Candidatus Halobonum tyrrellensis]ESP89480.1 transcription initiation factor tfiiib, brf1 subunit/transcription initiation factor tfiib [Candidatus Halobonum tyrrellensis G22]
MYRASDEVQNEEWLTDLRRAAESLELSGEARSNATDLFLSHVPDADRSKPATAAAALYAGALIAGDERSQTDVADAMDVTRLSVQQRWKELLRDAGFSPPTW